MHIEYFYYFYTDNQSYMIYRNLGQNFKKSLSKYPILALTGPRQSGKTTLLRTMLPDYKYVSLENPDSRSFALEDPRGFLKLYNDKTILDEVQRAPDIFSYLQTVVDQNQVMGQYILSGSQNFHLMQQITQSLAGRVGLFRLFPFDFDEMRSADWLSPNLSEVFVKGFYPAVFNRQIDPDEFYANYIDTYVSRDVTQLVHVQDSKSFRNFLKHCAVRAGSLLNYNDLARDAGISHSTSRNWLSVLETSYILYTVTPFYNNFSKRLIKSPKLYFYDTGLLCHLLGIRNGEIDPTFSNWGNLFENTIISELMKRNAHLTQHREYNFWRDSNGLEIDLMYAKSGKLNVYEIKASSTITSSMYSGIEKFEKITSIPLQDKMIIYGGSEDQQRTNFKISSWSKVK